MTNADYEKFKELAEQMNKDRESQHLGGTCPNCGYCPHCGRGRQMMPIYPSYPWWGVQPWYGPTWTVTGIGTVPVSVAGNVTSYIGDNISYTNPYTNLS